MRWQILGKKGGDVIGVLLRNRNIVNPKEFFNPKNPEKITIYDLGIGKGEVGSVVKRIKLAKKKKESVIVYGDYDADGICATAISWEALHEFGLKVLPHIPDRFTEGYGINAKSVKSLKEKFKDLRLIVTVDNGIVAYDGIFQAKKLGIDVVVLDHHQKSDNKLPTDLILHTTEVCGSALAYFFAKEIGYKKGLELAAIGTIADQMELLKINRSVVKYGLKVLEQTKRPGLISLMTDSKINSVGTYEVNYIIAPRINAMGRLARGLDSLRLLCTKKMEKAKELSSLLAKTNFERQKIVDGVILRTGDLVTEEKIIVIAGESYHEGVIGLAAGKLVEKYYRPAIVLSKGKKVSKASARSISGFNIIEAIRTTGLILEGGGHPMAAGFSIETSKIDKFRKEINKLFGKILTDELLEKKLKIDMEVGFSDITYSLCNKLKDFEPFGMGNPAPTFCSKNVEVLEVRGVGKDGKHLKLKLKQDEYILDAIFFGGGESYPDLKIGEKIDTAYNVEENVWNSHTSLQLKIRDIMII